MNFHKDGDTKSLTERKLSTMGGVLTTKVKLHRVLGMTGFCPIWVTDFGLVEKALSEVLKGGDIELLE